MPKRLYGYQPNKRLTLLLATLVMLLSGCATNTNLLETLSPTTVVAPDEGIVVVRVINATDYSLPINQVTIAPANLNESDKIKFQRLMALDVLLDDTSVFASPVKAGNYAMSSIRAYHFWGDRYWSHFASTDAKFGTFSVEPGKVTDLGTIIYYHKPQEDRYLQMLVRMPEHETGEVLSKYFPFYQYQPATTLGWLEDGGDEQRETDFLSIAQNPTVFEDEYKAPDGSLYFLGKLGVFVIRTPEGEWQIDAVDTIYNLNAIAQNTQGDIIVGGEEGKLFWKRRGREWQDISLAHDVKVAALSFKDDTHVDLITQSGTLVTINRAEVADQLEWLEINRYTSNNRWKVVEKTEQQLADEQKQQEKNKNKKPKPAKEIVAISLSKSDDVHYITVESMSDPGIRFFTDGTEHRYAYDPATWTMFKPESESEVTLTLQAGKVELGVTEAGFWSWTGRPTFSRFDSQSKKWEEISTDLRVCPDGTSTLKATCPSGTDGKPPVKSQEEDFGLISVPLFTSDLEALAIVNFSDIDFWSGVRSNEIKILKTTDGGKNWLDTGNTTPTKYCTSLVTEIYDRLLVSCNGATGDFYESFDEGKTWQNVRQQINF